MVIQDLLPSHDSNADIPSKCNLTVSLSIWLLDSRRHPYQRGKLVFEDKEKRIRLGSSDKIMQGLLQGLESAKQSSKRFLVVPSRMGFGQQGNPNLGIPGSSALIIEVLSLVYDFASK